jgi:putative MFS transporter
MTNDGAGGDLLARIDAAPLTPRYAATFSLIMLLLVFEIFDFFVVGFLVSAVAPAWGLTFGQTSVMLLSAGVGAIFGALGFGWLADRRGRKLAIVASALICSVCAGSLAFVPEGDWGAFSFLRFLVGVGYGGAGASQFALITEYTPLKRRTLLTSSVAVPAGLGLLLASSVVTTLFPILGWRGTAALGYAPIALALAVGFVAPESARWLLANGRIEDARRAAASMLGASLQSFAAAPAAAPAAPAPKPAAPRPAKPWELLSDPRRFALVVLVQTGLGATLTGVLLWGPTILALLLGISPAAAASWFIAVSLAGLAGRATVAGLANRFGRRPVGQLTAYAGAGALALAAVFHGGEFGGVSLFLIFLIVGHFFYDGAFANVITYAAELYPVRLAGQGMGLSAASGGLGKILGPLALGLLAGSGNLVTPQATEQAILPGFLFLAGCCLGVGAAFSLLGEETHRRPLALA